MSSRGVLTNTKNSPAPMTESSPSTSADRTALVVGLLTSVGLLALLYLMYRRLDWPPFWDATWSTYAGAIELSRNGFEYYPSLLAEPGYVQGGSGARSASLMTPFLGIVFSLFDAPTAVALSHLTMVAVGGLLAGATYSLASRYISRELSVLVAVASVTAPIVVQQVADPYVDLPLALFSTLAVTAVLDGRRSRAVLFTALAIWVKPTGLILLPVIGLMGERDEAQRWRRNAVGVASAMAPFALQLMTSSSFTARGDAGRSVEGTVYLLRNALASLATTTDLVLVFGLFVLAFVKWRRERPELIRVTGMVTLAFFFIGVFAIVLSQGVTILPRYYVVLVPLWMTVVAVYLQERHSTRAARWFLIGLIGLAAVNWNGSLYLLADHPGPNLVERSPGAAEDYLELEVEGARSLQEVSDSVDLLIVDSHMSFRLRYPELGFVETTPDNIVLHSEVPSELPDSFAWVDETYFVPGEEELLEVVEAGDWTLERRTLAAGRWETEFYIARR